MRAQRLPDTQGCSAACNQPTKSRDQPRREYRAVPAAACAQTASGVVCQVQKRARHCKQANVYWASVSCWGELKTLEGIQVMPVSDMKASPQPPPRTAPRPPYQIQPVHHASDTLCGATSSGTAPVPAASPALGQHMSTTPCVCQR